MKKAELLAPAGNYESFLGAIHAGADAVYLGGSRFGARAYADNLTTEEVCRAIRYAHLSGRRVYLTVNTLVKERELHAVYDYIKPFYESGLDAVIVQDMGVFERTGEWFPGLARHISTQMTVTGAYGAAFLKKLHADRIVTARELSLEELRTIRERTDIELEVFIHGAMCYSYSGQCLFSSILGGRSGNRGRCAQPCRLPWQTDTGVSAKRSGYLLSLKDLCSVSLLPELLKTGVDSLKIEGRMKRPEYAAGVTAVYRRYIDRYYEHPEKPCRVEPGDMDRLKALYIRSETGEGYFRRHNGREMLTPDSPGYSGTEEELLKEIRSAYLQREEKLPAKGSIRLHRGEPARYTVTCRGLKAAAQGDPAQAAKSRPLSREDVVRQLRKSGNTFFKFDSVETDMDADIFLPVKALNELRRTACEKLERALSEKYGPDLSRRRAQEQKPPVNEREAERRTGTFPAATAVTETEQKAVKAEGEALLHVSVMTEEQLSAALVSEAERIYINADLQAACGGRAWAELLSEKRKNTKLYLALPYIIRKRDGSFLERTEKLLRENIFSGVLIRNLEEAEWVKEISFGGNVVTDAGLYLWNSASGMVWARESAEQYLPLELNVHELEELLKKGETKRLSCVVYGRLPMMISAGCVAKTAGECRRENERKDAGPFLKLTDRRRTSFPVYVDCEHCCNVIYNSVPLSLHRYMDRLKGLGLSSYRLDFTTENGPETGEIIRFFRKRMRSSEIEPPFSDYTGGHFKRGVE